MIDVVVLGLLINSERADVPGQLIKRGRCAAGHVLVAINGARISVPLAKVMSAQAYFNALKDKIKLPDGAIGRPWFQEAAESEGTRGNLLKQILNKGDEGNETKE